MNPSDSAVAPEAKTPIEAAATALEPKMLSSEQEKLLREECEKMRRTAATLRVVGYCILGGVAFLFWFGGYVFFRAAEITGSDLEARIKDARKDVQKLLDKLPQPAGASESMPGNFEEPRQQQPPLPKP